MAIEKSICNNFDLRSLIVLAFSIAAIRSECVHIRSPDKSAHWKIIFFISHPKHVVGTQKNRLNETVLLSTQNTCLN